MRWFMARIKKAYKGKMSHLRQDELLGRVEEMKMAKAEVTIYYCIYGAALADIKCSIPGTTSDDRFISTLAWPVSSMSYCDGLP